MNDQVEYIDDPELGKIPLIDEKNPEKIRNDAEKIAETEVEALEKAAE